jgi:hypothetical protein
MAELNTLVSGLVVGESPRWHDPGVSSAASRCPGPAQTAPSSRAARLSTQRDKPSAAHFHTVMTCERGL